MRRLALLTLVACSAALFAGCSSYNRQWQAALAQPIPADSIAGPWEGEWRSAKNNHHGRLRCIVTPLGGDAYEAAFHARFWKIFSAGYTIPLHVTRDGASWKFSGESDLGWLAGGNYACAGTATPTNFFSTYQSKYDHGTFQMTRPPADAAE